MKRLKIGELFAGIGGFSLGVERAIPNSETIWMVEKDKFCQSILKKHWPDAEIFDDVREVGSEDLKPVDILLGGFPCQNISIQNLNNREGLQGEKSGLWFEMHRVISELRPRVAIIENTANIVNRGGVEVIGSLAEIGYSAEWTIISARQFGAPHVRKRWFCVAYPDEERCSQQSVHPESVDETFELECSSSKDERIHIGNYWKEHEAPPSLHNLDDGFPFVLARNQALGNAIVPQCSEWVGQQVLKSGLLDGPCFAE